MLELQLSHEIIAAVAVVVFAQNRRADAESRVGGIGVFACLPRQIKKLFSGVHNLPLFFLCIN